eukprot:SAG31_NODE_13974_length_834_cov_0.770068_2_plen_207_part_01
MTKIMLALKYHRPDALEKILNETGTEMNSCCQPYPFLYAAYHDMEDAFAVLRGHGFSGCAGHRSHLNRLDLLILAELRATMRAEYVKKHLQSKSQAVTLWDYDLDSAKISRRPVEVTIDLTTQRTVKARQDFSATTDVDTLSFVGGKILSFTPHLYFKNGDELVVEEATGEWWKGCLKSDGNRTGYFPARLVRAEKGWAPHWWTRYC